MALILISFKADGKEAVRHETKEGLLAFPVGRPYRGRNAHPYRGRSVRGQLGLTPFGLGRVAPGRQVWTARTCQSRGLDLCNCSPEPPRS